MFRSIRSCLDWMERRQSVGKSIHPFCNKVLYNVNDASLNTIFPQIGFDFSKINLHFSSGEARPPGDGMYRRPLLRCPLQLGAAPERTTKALPGEQTNKMHSNSSVFAALNCCGVTLFPLSCRFCEKNLLFPPVPPSLLAHPFPISGGKKSERGKATSLSAV